MKGLYRKNYTERDYINKGLYYIKKKKLYREELQKKNNTKALYKEKPIF